MRLSFVFVLALATVPACRCGSIERPPPPQIGDAGAPKDRLDRASIFVGGASSPVPISMEFTEDAPSLGPPLARLAEEAHGGPAALEVSRDVPYGQVHRLMRAGIAVRIAVWSFATPNDPPFQAALAGGFPVGDCFVRAWVAPDRAVHVGMRVTPAGEVGATIVRAANENVQTDKVLALIRRLDATCAEGEARLYTQPTADAGPLFDLARAIAAAKPHVSTIVFDRPSVGPLDSPNAVVP